MSWLFSFGLSGMRRSTAGRAVRRALLSCTTVLLWMASAGAHATAQCEADWPLWQQFNRHFVASDGRVIDASVPEMHSTSEGQSYGMFFALVANDRPAFDRIWTWSIANLMEGSVEGRLPAWRWGKRADGSWGVLDTNAASDADLWFAYALLEAARLWQAPQYAHDAKTLLDRIRSEEVVNLPGVGAMLLPGPVGFALDDQVWRLNPSYLPVPLLRGLASGDELGPWNELAENTAHMLEQVSPRGLVADWVGYQALSANGGHFVGDPVKGDLGSYDAIRVYLWAGMTHTADPLAARVMQSVRGLLPITTTMGAPPEVVSTTTGIVKGHGNYGFSAALLPYLQAGGQQAMAEKLAQQVRDQLAQDTVPHPAQPPSYYSYMLSLFGLGFYEERYRFLSSGALQPSWEKACRRVAAR